MKHYENLIDSLRSATKLPILQALMNEAADEIERLEAERGYNFPIREKRMDNCPLVPVPPHGRLIEESKVLDIVSAWCPDDDGSVGKVGDLREMLDEIENLPTIIPAEEE